MDLCYFELIMLEGDALHRKYQESCLTLHSKAQNPESLGEQKIRWKTRVSEKANCLRGEPSSQLMLRVESRSADIQAWFPESQHHITGTGMDISCLMTALCLSCRGVVKHGG